VGGFTYVGCDRDESVSNTNTTPPVRTTGDKVEDGLDKAGDKIADATDKTVDATRRAGEKVGDAAGNLADDAREAGARIGRGSEAAPDAEGIRDVLASATEAALTENGLNDVTERLVDADRNRIGDAIGKEFDDYNALVKQFRADWKAKYGQEFDIEKEEAVYPDTLVSVRQGEIGKEAPSGAEIVTGDKPGDVDANREAGRNVASIQFAESHGMAALSVPLIHELPDAWRIDVPDTIDAGKLKSNMMAHLKAAHDMKDQWPADVNQAYAAVTHHVLEALLDKPVGK
jgi:hypothetical protein